MSSKSKLSTYRKRRQSGSTPEPLENKGRDTDGPLFVIQRHDASQVHFDLRLQIGDVLVSWAVPKGPSVDPREKRLAKRTEDHPLDYVDFEGAIPEDEYGGGTVVVWDTGTFENLTTDDDDEAVSPDKALRDGHLKFRLDGEKLTGGFALTRTKMHGDDDSWLLVKVDDDGADRRRKPAKTQPESVLSGRTNEDLEEEQDEES